MSDDSTSALTSPIVQQGRVVAFFAFDIGHEISLENTKAMLASSPIQPLSRKKQTPNYLQYTHRPQVISLGPIEAFDGLKGEILATIFDFGAVSISYHWSLSAQPQVFTLDHLPEVSQRIFDFNLEEHARSQVEKLMERIRPAITRPELSNLVEDYYVFVIERFGRSLKADELLSHHSDTLAQILQFDTEALSPAQRSDALSKAISYYERDLVLIDWNASIVYDSDYVDTLNVLELLNVELLEARYMDAQLDKRIKNYEKLSQKQHARFMPLSSPYRQSINELAELRIESSVLAERVDNCLKLIGDLYLARVYSAASEQFHMPTWDASISRKLDIIGNLYQILTDRVHSSQTQMLELIIIILIFIEIVMSLFH